MKRMLINATQAEELRVAIVDGQNLYDIDIEQPSKEQKKSNIYKGRIVRLEPSLEAAFVEYGGERHGFLPLKEISRDYFVPGVDPNKAGLKEFLREGQEVVVQVDKEERGNKGAALTTFISLAGRYMVLMPNSPTAGGVSRRIEGEDRAELKKAMDSLNIPDDMGVIIRTVGEGQKARYFVRDLAYLVEQWRNIELQMQQKKAAACVFQEPDLVERTVRDFLTDEIEEVVCDDEASVKRMKELVGHVSTRSVNRITHYREPVPIFERYGGPLTGHTFTGHTAACAAGVAVQKIIERDKLVEKVAAEGPFLMQSLRGALADRPYVGNIRGRGFFIGIELVADRETKEPYDCGLQLFARVRDRSFENGLICYPSGGNVDGVKGDQIILAPPYNATKSELGEIVDKLATSLTQVMAAL